MRTRAKGLVWAGGVWVGLLGSGCVPSVSGSYRCQRDADCAWGWQCDEVRGVCVSSGPGDASSGDGGDAATQSCVSPGTAIGCATNQMCCGFPARCQPCPVAGAQAFGCGVDGSCVATACASGYAPCHGHCEQWLRQTVAQSVGGNTTSLALDVQGRPHVSFFDTVDYDLEYGWWDGSQWQFFTVAAEGYVGTDSVLVLDRQDNPHLVFLDGTNDAAQYAARDAIGHWSYTTLGAIGSSRLHADVAFDTTGYPHVVFSSGAVDGDLQYAYWNGATWVDGGPLATGVSYKYVSLAIDHDDTLHLTYLRPSGSDSVVTYAKKEKGLGWDTRVVATVSYGRYVSMDLGPDERPSIAYRHEDGSDAWVRYAYWDGDGFSEPEVVDGCAACGTTSEVGDWIRLAVDPKGVPSLIFFAGGYTVEQGLRYARRGVDGTWCVYYLEQGVGVGERSSLAVDAEGTPHAVFVDVDNLIHLVRK